MFGDDYIDYGIDIYEYSVDEAREDLNRVVSYFRSMDYHEHAMNLFLEQFREMPKELADLADAFCIDEELSVSDLPEWIKSDTLGIVRKNCSIMAGRCVFPVKDVNSNVMGFVGWDPFEDPKYLDSKNYGYKAKATTLYGMESLNDYYRSNEPVFLTEGLMCTWYLRLNGFCALSSLGSYLTPYVIQILKRFGSRLVVVPDNDETGNKFAKQVRRYLPKARIVQVRYGKDIDGCRRLEEHKYEKDLLNDLRLMKLPIAPTKILIRV